MKVRTDDVLYALDQLEEMKSTGPFAGLMDLDAVAAAGHSLGGITAPYTRDLPTLHCSNRLLCPVAIRLTGGWF